MNIVLKSSHLQFKNPILGQPSRAVEEHYYARRIVAILDGEERQFKFMANELPFYATEEEMVLSIQKQLSEEQQSA